MRTADLYEPERRLWVEFSYGTHLDLRTEDPQQNDPAGAQSWGPDRVVRAEVIRDLLIGRRPADQQPDDQLGSGKSPSVFLCGARIAGRLDLSGIAVTPPLLLYQCALDEPLVINDGMSSSIRLYGCHLPGVEGAWLRCAGDLHIRDCLVTGEVDLSGAYVGGQLVLSGSTLSNPEGIAVRANGLVVAGDFFCRDQAVTEGEVNLVAARIGGELRLTGSALHNPGRVALRADRITVEKDVYCRQGLSVDGETPFSADGEVRISDGHIKGQLNFNHATLSNPGGVALRADHLVVGSHLYCQDQFTTHGEVSLVAARVGGEVRFSASALSNPGCVALRAERLFVADDMYCRQGLTVAGEVDLQGAHVKGQLNFNRATLSNSGGVALRADHLVVGSHLYCQDQFTTHGEIRLVAARVGGEVRFSTSTLSNPEKVALCGERLTVAGDMFCREGLTVAGEVNLRAAQIGGQLNFNRSELSNEGGTALQADYLVLGGHLYCHDGCHIKGATSLVAARIGGEVRFSASTLSNPGQVVLGADRLVVDKDMYCREGLEIDGQVRLHGARVNGDLIFSTATVHNPDDTAIYANQLTVGNDLCCDEGFTADGMIDLTDVHVNGELSLCGATLRNRNDVVLLAPRLIVDKDMFCRDGFVADGTICLIGAHIGGKLSFTGAHLTGAMLTDQQLTETGIKHMLTNTVQPTGSRYAAAKPVAEGKDVATDWRAMLQKNFWLRSYGPEPGGVQPSTSADVPIVNGESGLALVADGLRVETDLTCDAGFTACGEIRLSAARIRQNLDFNDGAIENQAGLALNVQNLQAERMLMPARCEAGRISLRYGKMIELDDKRGVEPDQIDITGLSYETLIPPLDPETRLRWMAKNEYEPQPYDQLARSYRQLGYDDSARKVQLAQERRRRETLVSPVSRMWGYLQDVTIGYGYRPYRAAALFGLVLLVGIIGFWSFPLMPIEDSVHPQFNPVFYTLNVLIPFADFGQRDLFTSTVGHEIFKVILAVFGWTLAVTAITGLTRALTRS